MYEVTNMRAFQDLIEGKITKKQFINLQNNVQKTFIPEKPNISQQYDGRRNNRTQNNKIVRK